MTYENATQWEDLISEKELLELTGVAETSLRNLRVEGKLPYTYLTKNCRYYFVADLINLFQENRTVGGDSET